MAEMQDWGPRTLTGRDVQRIDAIDKVTGKAKYTYDVTLPGMLYGRILRSPHPHARVVSVDLSPALAHPQVKSVVDFEKKTVRYAGEEVAAVAAETEEAADEAIRQIGVQYEILPFSVVEEQSMAEGAPEIHPQGNVVIPERRQRDRGDVAAGFAEAAAIVEQTYRTQVQMHNSLETHGAMASWDDDRLTVYSSTQSIVGARDGLARYFKIPTSQVRVLTEHMGGGLWQQVRRRRGGDVCCQVVEGGRCASSVDDDPEGRESLCRKQTVRDHEVEDRRNPGREVYGIRIAHVWYWRHRQCWEYPAALCVQQDPQRQE